jgi:flagellin-like hook-associated protein FlgL
MNITGVGARSSLVVQSLGEMRVRLGELQRQLGTGKKSTTYAGLGLERGLAVGLRTKLATLTGYATAATQTDVRLKLQQEALGRLSDLRSEVKAGTLTQFEIDASGQTRAQRTAAAALDEMFALLNAPAGDRYLFSGRAVDKPATDTTDRILNGDATHAGFRDVLAERNQADLGATGLGRLVIPAAVGTQVTISEDVAGSPFGFKLTGVSTLNGATVSGPTGSPPGITIDVTTNPSSGDAISFTFALPDGSTKQLTLTATTNAPPAEGEFTIGATPADTATNLQAAATTAVGKLAATSLSAASAMAAAHMFFDVDAGQPPMRVAGPPYDSATGLVPGTSANTITWYTGEMASDPARGTAVAKVDDALTISYGARANEDAIRSTIQSVAVFAAMTFSASDPNAEARFDEMKERVSNGLTPQNGQQKIEDIAAELAFAQTTMQSAQERQQERKLTLESLLQGVEEAPQTEVAAQILALQTRLQASLQTTAMLYQMNIVNYL